MCRLINESVGFQQTQDESEEANFMFYDYRTNTRFMYNKLTEMVSLHSPSQILPLSNIIIASALDG
jgi:hypothetical protein